MNPCPAAAGAGIVPAWARRLAGSPEPVPVRPLGPSGVPCSVSLATGAGLALVEVAVPDAGVLTAAVLRQVAEETYRTIHRLAGAVGRPHPLRFWNVVPGINDPVAAGRTRYMLFNGGRFAALTAWLGPPDGRLWAVPTATGVGGRGGDLRVACLLGREPGLPVENPRQQPSYSYDSRFGPLPPCFSRATVATVDGQRRLLVGGTASVRGQQSLHHGRLGSQYDETCRNLAALIGQARTGQPDGLERVVFDHLRAYVPRSRHVEEVRSLLRSTLRCRSEVEILSMDLCRPELLVELEGMVPLSGPESG